MRHALRLSAIILVLAIALPALGDDQQKAKKEINKITAMASDSTGRRTVNVSLAEQFNAKRIDLLMERRNTGMNYGSLFLAHQLVSTGAKMDDVTAKLKGGKNIYQIADEQHADWKQIASAAKSLNGKIDDNLYKHFVSDKGEKEKDLADSYDIAYDGVEADKEITQAEIDQAADRYQLWRGRAEEVNKRANKLGTAEQNAAYRDNARSAGPQSQGGATGGAPPAAGGPR